MAESTLLQHVVTLWSWLAGDVNLRNPLRADEKAHKPGIHLGFEAQYRCH